MTLTFDKPTPLVRAESDWTRDDNGRPWVLPDPAWSPEQTAQWLASKDAKDGQRPYTRVTTFVEAPLDGTMLAKWKMRRVALGMGRRPDYVVAAAALTAEDRDKASLNDLAEKALEAAGPNAADIGTALHQFTERIDRGEPLGFVPDQYRADLEAYRTEIARVTWLHREERMVCDALEVAGTPDGIGYVDEPDPDGVTGVPRIIDLKTGDVERTAGKFAAQLAVYAHSAIYDAATGARTWLPELSLRWGLVLHMPAGVGTARFRWINLEHGWLGAQLSRPIRAWRSVNHADIMRPLVKPEPRQVAEGMCAGRKRTGEPCGYKAKTDGFCKTHADQLGQDPNAAVPRRVTDAAAVVSAALSDVEKMRRVVNATPEEADALVRLATDLSTTVDEPVDDLSPMSERLAAVARGDDPDAPEDPFIGITTTDVVEDEAPTVPEPESCDSCSLDGRPCPGIAAHCARGQHCVTVTEVCALEWRGGDNPAGHPRTCESCGASLDPEPVEQNGNPTPHTSMPDPDSAADAARDAELALMDQVRECRTTGELDILWERTGFAWTHHVKAYAKRHREGLPAMAQRERTAAALLNAIAGCRSLPELQSLGLTYPADLWTDEAKTAARTAAADLPPF